MSISATDQKSIRKASGARSARLKKAAQKFAKRSAKVLQLGHQSLVPPVLMTTLSHFCRKARIVGTRRRVPAPEPAAPFVNMGGNKLVLGVLVRARALTTTVATDAKLLHKSVVSFANMAGF